jgi:predicted transposase/invertase (TIGR01784 family)
MSPVHKHEEFEAYVPFVQYYAVNAYIKQIELLEEVIFLAFIDHIMFPDKPEYKSSKVIFDKYSYNNTAVDKNDLKKFSFTIIELPKFPKTEIEQLKNDEERWLYTFKYANKMTKKDLDRMFPVDIIVKAYAELNTSNWSEKELIAYDTSLKRTMDANSIMAQKFDEGKEEGEKQAKIAIVRNSLKAGISIDVIAEITGLSINEIENLRDTIQVEAADFKY